MKVCILFYFLTWVKVWWLWEKLVSLFLRWETHSSYGRVRILFPTSVSLSLSFPPFFSTHQPFGPPPVIQPQYSPSPLSLPCVGTQAAMYSPLAGSPSTEHGTPGQNNAFTGWWSNTGKARRQQQHTEAWLLLTPLKKTRVANKGRFCFSKKT